jgi:hypothetical protein
MLVETVLARVSSINDLEVIMDEKMNFSEHGKAFTMLGFIIEDCHSSSEIHTL